MYRHFNQLNFVLVTAALFAVCSITCAQSGFDDPTDLSLQNNGFPNDTLLQQQVPANDGFVPATAPETRLIPVAPRGGSQESIVSPPDLSRQNSYRPTLEPDVDGNFEPIVPGRANLRSVIEGFDEVGDEQPDVPAGPEVIRQRYPDGKIQVLREVSQDEEGNYFNHGQWKLFNRQGQILAEGRFQNGVMDGLWRRWHPAGSKGIFSSAPFNLFRGPFLSAATFNKGEMDGAWTLMDHFERKVFEIPYTTGRRDGTATWWYPSSMKMREVTFKDGLLDGAIREWNGENKLVRQDEYIEGKKIIRQTTFYRPKQKQAENFFLDSKLEPEGPDDWWQARPAALTPSGNKLQHGPALAWYDNGQPKMKGQYKDDVRVGKFTWWHPNGQKQLTGSYDGIGEKSGNWSWWHPSGLKSIQGQYEDDQPVGVWRWWNENGQVTNEEDMDNREEEAATTDEPEFETDGSVMQDVTEPDITPLNDPAFREPMERNTDVSGSDEESSIIVPDSTDDMEEIFGEGETDVLPEGKLVPDDDET